MTLSAPTAAPTRRVERVRHELRQRALEVTHVQPLGPGFVSISFGGEELAGFTSLSFDDHLKFMFTADSGEPVRRDYTPRHYDPVRGELRIEFALHGHGEASAWARQAAPGQQVRIGGPRGSMIIPTDYDWHLLAGDATALPAIHRRLEELSAGARATVLVQVDDVADQRHFDSAASVECLWVSTAAEWLQALRDLQRPEGDGFVWCAGEASVMAQARSLLLELGYPREAMRVAAYWKQGASGHHENLEA